MTTPVAQALSALSALIALIGQRDGGVEPAVDDTFDLDVAKIRPSGR